MTTHPPSTAPTDRGARPPATVIRMRARRGARRISRPTSPEEAERLVPALARWYLEYLAGQRTVDQIAPLLTPAVEARLRARRITQRTRTGTTPDPSIAATAVIRTSLKWTSPTRCEATALVQRGGRTTALAITLQRLPHRWRVTELASPEDGVTALHAAPVPAG